MKRNIIFGAGVFGRDALNHYGEDTVAFFVDNSPVKQGTIYCNRKVLSLDDAIEMGEEFHYIVASLYYASMEKTLTEKGISDYEIFRNENHGFYETGELIVNPYLQKQSANSEDEWNESETIDYSKQGVFDEVEKLHKVRRLFNHIEIETINRCNGICSFCPVNRNSDKVNRK